MGPKSDDSYRIDSHNIDCLGLEAIGNQKQNTLKDWIAKKDIDIIGMQEIGISNHMLPKHERIAERIRDYRRSQIRVVAANNKNENIDKFQWGGTTTIAYDMLANMTRASGVDETGLGRWSCVQLEGYENKRVRVLSAYNPCRTHTHQFATVYSQQKRYFLSKKIDICPWLKFRQSLVSLLTTWQSQGEQIILLIDCNENLTQSKDVQKHLSSEPLSLVDPIRYRYGNLTSLPPTANTGSYPIDSIFVSSALTDIERGGWFPLGEGGGDHRVLFHCI